MKIVWRIVRPVLTAIGGAVVLVFITEANWATRKPKSTARLDTLVKLRYHYASEHGGALEPDVTLEEAEAVHFRDHTGPCGIRNHELSSLHFDPVKARLVFADAEAM